MTEPAAKPPTFAPAPVKKPAPAKPPRPKLDPQAQAALILEYQLRASQANASSSRAALRLKSAAAALTVATTLGWDVAHNGGMTWSVLVILAVVIALVVSWRMQFGSDGLSEETEKQIKTIIREHRAKKKAEKAK